MSGDDLETAPGATPPPNAVPSVRGGMAQGPPVLAESRNNKIALGGTVGLQGRFPVSNAVLIAHLPTVAEAIAILERRR